MATPGILCPTELASNKPLLSFFPPTYMDLLAH